MLIFWGMLIDKVCKKLITHHELDDGDDADDDGDGDDVDSDSGPRSDARSDTPRYPERYLKSMKLGSTPHGHLKLYNLCYRWKNMGSMNKGTLKFFMG